MRMTPLVRYKNINLENLKKFIKMYPYIVDRKKWEESFKLFDFKQIGNNYEGYKRTAYQFACQVALENRGNEYFEVHDYLFYLNDEELKKYLNFWCLTYYAPNPYVNSSDAPKIIWVDIVEHILSSPNLVIDYYQYFHDNINDQIDIENPTNLGNPDTLKNVMINYGDIGLLKIKDNRYIYIEEEKRDKAKETIQWIKDNYPIPKDYKDKSEFFNRYSFDNYSKVFPKKCEKQVISKVHFSNSFDIENLYYEDKEKIQKQIYKALKNGKNIILCGPPGTGKSKLAKQICKFYKVNYNMVTATSDWSTYETIGGYKQNNDGRLLFEPGLFLSCFKDEKHLIKNDWLILDEMNRADIDKAFGTFFSVLTGDSVNLGYKDNDNNNIQIINENDLVNKEVIEEYQYVIPNDWRMIGTINTFDKTSLFEMSYAFMRRFAFIYIGVPQEITVDIVREYLTNWGISDKVIGATRLSEGLAQIWKLINCYRVIGPAILKDIALYVETKNDWSSSLILYVLPQFDGLDEDKLFEFCNKLSGINIDGLSEEIDYIKQFIKDFFNISIE